MGIKVFLVEDEMVIRNGIVKGINWEKEGYRLVGEASDGELAYPMILKEKPDILLTDIKMPFMDGLELSRLVKQELPDTKILIFSGYDEFEYAQQAEVHDYGYYKTYSSRYFSAFTVIHNKSGKIVYHRRDEHNDNIYRFTP